MILQFKSITDLLKAFPNEQACINHLENIRWNGNVVSPFDKDSKVYICKGNRYHCKNTGKYFNVKTATVFEDSKIPFKTWFVALYLFSSHKKGISSHQLARDLNVTQKTAWFMLHRLRYIFEHKHFEVMLGENNIVEIDETYVGGKEINKHQSKKVEGTQGRSTKTKTPVLGMIERGGYIIAEVVSDTTQKTIEPIINQNVTPNAQVATDEWKSYAGLSKKFRHEVIKHQAKEYVNGAIHTNSIESFWALMKRGLTGIYHHVEPQHLKRYVKEFTLRFNTRSYETAERFDFVLTNMVGRLTYKTLISHKNNAKIMALK